MQVTATEAKNRFGFVCAQAKNEPVFVEKDGRIDSVILSLQAFQDLQAQGQRGGLAQRRQAFNEAYKDWIAEQNARFEQHGLWCDELRPW